MTDPRQITLHEAWLASEPFRLERDQVDGVDFLPTIGGRLDCEFLDRWDAARAATVWSGDHYQHALALYERVAERSEMYRAHAEVRAAEAAYLRETVAPWAAGYYGPGRAAEYERIADQLERARPWANWGHDFSNGSLVVDFCDRAGLVKLCPDDAREEGARAGELYGKRIEALQEQGYEVRFCVFTLPNSPRHHLGAAIDAIFERFRREILYSRVDGRMARSLDDRRRRFPELRGAVASLEAPLSARGDWNVHLNVLMVFDGYCDYAKYHEAWGAGLRFATVPTGAVAAACKEVFKYALRAVSAKSADKAASGQSTAPPLVEWPPDAFDEWWRAHKGFRRTRSWGELYAAKLDDLPRRDPECTEYIGTIKVTPQAVYVERPKRVRFTERWTELEAIDALEVAAESDARRRERENDLLFLIQGNKSADFPRPQGTGPPS